LLKKHAQSRYLACEIQSVKAATASRNRVLTGAQRNVPKATDKVLFRRTLWATIDYD